MKDQGTVEDLHISNGHAIVLMVKPHTRTGTKSIGANEVLDGLQVKQQNGISPL